MVCCCKKDYDKIFMRIGIDVLDGLENSHHVIFSPYYYKIVKYFQNGILIDKTSVKIPIPYTIYDDHYFKNCPLLLNDEIDGTRAGIISAPSFHGFVDDDTFDFPLKGNFSYQVYGHNVSQGYCRFNVEVNVSVDFHA